MSYLNPPSAAPSSPLGSDSSPIDAFGSMVNGCAQFRADFQRERCLWQCGRCWPDSLPKEPQTPSYETFQHVAVEKLRPSIEFWSPEHLEDGRIHHANAMGVSGLRGNINTSMNWVQFCSCGTVFLDTIANVRATLGVDEEPEKEVTNWDLWHALDRIDAQVNYLLGIGPKPPEREPTMRDLADLLDKTRAEMRDLFRDAAKKL